MASIRRHEDLIAWQLAYELKKHVLTFTARPAVARHTDFCEDIRRAARSAPANLAEAFGRFWPRDSAKFARYALGSLAELKNHLKDAIDENYISESEFREMWRLAVRATGATAGWIGYLMTCDPKNPEAWKHKPPPDAIRHGEPRTAPRTEPFEPLEPLEPLEPS